MNTEQLVSNLLNGNTNERLKATENLVKTDARLTVYSLIHALEEFSEGRQTKVIESLTQVGAAAIPLLIEILKCNNVPLSKLASDALVQIGSSAVEAVIAGLDERTWYKRERSAETLGNMGDPRAVQPLIRVLEGRPYSENAGKLFSDWDAYVCSAAIEALGKLGDSQALEPLAQMSDDPSASIRQAAVQALSNWKHKSAAQKRVSADMCVKMLDDPSQEVRLSAVRTLAKLKDPQAIPALIRRLNDSFLCGEILDDLEKIRFDATSVDLLLSAVEDGNQSSERYILDKLKQIGPDAAGTLVNALKGPNRPQRLMAARALAGLKDVRAVDTLLDFVQDHGNWDVITALAEIGQPAIQPLLGRLRADDDSVGDTAMLSLYRMGTGSIPLFIQAIDSGKTEAYIRYRCADMITSICRENNTALKAKWQTCVCSEHLVDFRQQSLPLHINMRRILESRKRDYYLRQSALLSKLADAGVLTSKFSELLTTASTVGYYACPVCSQDRTYFSPVKQIVLVLDDDARNSAPAVKNEILYYPWSPLMSGFRFHRVEIHSVVYPYSTTIERFIHRLELERRPPRAPATTPVLAKIPCKISDSCKLSAADQNRLQVYCNLK